MELQRWRSETWHIYWGSDHQGSLCGRASRTVEIPEPVAAGRLPDTPAQWLDLLNHHHHHDNDYDRIAYHYHAQPNDHIANDHYGPACTTVHAKGLADA